MYKGLVLEEAKDVRVLSCHLSNLTNFLPYESRKVCLYYSYTY